jgi:hypothetical protein
MPYNIYVVTAARFVADLYNQMLGGRTLGEATTVARRSLAEDRSRIIGAVFCDEPVDLQDWTVPVVYEAARKLLVGPRESRQTFPELG